MGIHFRNEHHITLISQILSPYLNVYICNVSLQSLKYQVFYTNKNIRLVISLQGLQPSLCVCSVHWFPVRWNAISQYCE